MIGALGRNVILAVTCGSRLYGTHTFNSDHDIRGVYMTPNAELLGLFPTTDTLSGFEPATSPGDLDIDYAYWELGHFVQMASKGSFTALELLFAPSRNVLRHTPQSDLLRRYRDLFLTEQVRAGLLGFCRGQIKDATKKNSAKPHVHARRVLFTVSRLYNGEGLHFNLPDRSIVQSWSYEWENDPHAAEKLLNFVDAIANLPARFPTEPDWRAINRLLLNCRGVA